MIFGEKDGEKTALAVISDETIIRQPIEQLGITLKSMLTKAEGSGAKKLYIYVPLTDE